VRSAICHPAMRPVVIVLLDPASDAAARFLQGPIFRAPDFLLLQAAMEPFDVAVALWVMIGRAPVRDAEPPGLGEGHPTAGQAGSTPAFQGWLYVNIRPPFEVTVPAAYHVADVPCQIARAVAYRGDRLLLVTRQQGDKDAYLYATMGHDAFSMKALGAYAPTGVEVDDIKPPVGKIGRNTFYYFGPGGGGVCYPDQYFYDLDGQILIFTFVGPCVNNETPTSATKQLEAEMLASFQPGEPQAPK
jgi:hypothetical protein